MYRKPIYIIVVLVVVLLVGVAVASANSASHQSAGAYAFADGSHVGEAHLLRNNNGVTTQINVDGAPAGAYTMWWIVWNTPEGCFIAYACNEPDLFNPNAGLAIGYAGGTLVNNNGDLSITAHLNEGETLTRFPYPEFSAIGVQLTETTLVDTDHAEIHLVVRSHGPAIAGLISTATSTFNGACVYDPPINGSEPAYGTPGPNSCFDPYFSVFPSPNAP